MVNILNTIICYDNADEVIEYCNKIAKLKWSEKIAVVIVINKLTNKPIDYLKKRLNNIHIRTHIVNSGINLGYLNGMIEGYKEYKRKFDDKLDYIIMSNTDISFPDNEFLKLLLINDYPEEVWCIGPAVYVPYRDTFDNPVATNRRSVLEVKKNIVIFKTPYINTIYIKLSILKGKIMKRKIGDSRYVYEVHGCFFILRPVLVEKMINKPFKSLMYSEEAYVAEMIYHNNKKVYYDTTLLVEHNEHSVTGNLQYSKLAGYISNSMEVIYNEFYKGH